MRKFPRSYFTSDSSSPTSPPSISERICSNSRKASSKFLGTDWGFLLIGPVVYRLERSSHRGNDMNRHIRSILPLGALLGLLLMPTEATHGEGATTQPSDYPIVNTLNTSMTKKNRPSWSDVTSAAVLKGVNSGH